MSFMAHEYEAGYAAGLEAGKEASVGATPRDEAASEAASAEKSEVNEAISSEKCGGAAAQDCEAMAHKGWKGWGKGAEKGEDPLWFLNKSVAAPERGKRPMSFMAHEGKENAAAPELPIDFFKPPMHKVPSKLNHGAPVFVPGAAWSEASTFDTAALPPRSSTRSNSPETAPARSEASTFDTADLPPRCSTRSTSPRIDWDAVDPGTAHAMQQAFYPQSEQRAEKEEDPLWFLNKSVAAPERRRRVR